MHAERRCRSGAVPNLVREGRAAGGGGEEKKGSSSPAAAGTCGGLNVQRLQNGVPIYPVQAHQVAGVGVEARDAQTESSSRQREVLALRLVLHVCYLNDKAVKVPACGAPGGGEAVPRNV